MVWARRAVDQDGHPGGIEGMNDVADGLVVAAELLGDGAGGLAPCAGPQDLTAAQDEGIRRAQARIDGLLFGIRERTHKDWVSHNAR